MSSSNRTNKSTTAPKGRPTPSRTGHSNEITWWQRWGVQAQWAILAAIVVLTVLAIIIFSDPRPHGG
ncbi:MAG: hypothetical protein AAGA99_08605 [Actinomycetota bacterium]